MRTRKEIEIISFNQADKIYEDDNGKYELDTKVEILLDIRELLLILINKDVINI